MNPLVSVVVPTKNRYPYLEKLVELIDSFNIGDELELVIQDNNEDNTKFLDYLKAHEYKNVRYFFDPTPMPIALNCDNAINHSKGEYVCFIGDDDCVTNNILPCVKWMQRNNVECVYPQRISYYWPDFIGNKSEEASVHHWPFTNEVKFYYTSDVLKEAMDCGFIWTANMPMVYQGIVKRSVLDKFWLKCGTYFPGASPDIASSVSLCMVIDKFASFSFPIVIGGNSKTTGGGDRLLKHRAQTDFSKVAHLPKNICEIWDKRIPKIWCNPTIYCESAIEALNAWERPDLVEKVSFEALYCYFVRDYFYYRKMAYALTSNKFKLFVKSSLSIMIQAIKMAVKFVLRLLHIHLNNTRVEEHGINDVIELCNLYDNNNYHFDKHFQ